MSRMSARHQLCALSLLLAACGGGKEEHPRSALVITLDTTRYDALGCLGGPAGVSPRLDALAAEGVLYTEARTTVPLTLPAHASMLTGLNPPRHTVHVNGYEVVPASAVTLAERARERGFQTGAFIAAVVLADGFGLAQGFDHYDQLDPPLMETTLHYDRRPARAVADAAIGWIDALDKERPFLAWVHFYDPHQPYEPAPDLAARFGTDLYHASVATMDREIGRILDALRAQGLDDETLVIVVADHGEGRWEHGEETHGTQAYDSTMRVPMIVRYHDRFRAGERSDEIVGVVDVYPTAVEALGLGALNDVDGISLYRRTVPPDRGVYFETYYGYLSFGWSPVTGFADRSGKYIHSSRPELYTPRTDPGERADRIGSAGAEELERYRAAIRDLCARTPLARGEDPELGPEVARAMAALGYTAAGGGGRELPPALAPLEVPSPHDMQAVHTSFLLAQMRTNAEHAGEAVPLLQGIVAQDPGNVMAWFLLGAALIHTGDYSGALDASNRALQIGPPSHGPLLNVGLAHEHLGEPEEALAAYAAALALEPRLLDTLQRCSEICDALGRKAEADAYRVRLIEARGADALRRATLPGR
jgi:choline-sulfatase